MKPLALLLAISLILIAGCSLDGPVDDPSDGDTDNPTDDTPPEPPPFPTGLHCGSGDTELHLTWDAAERATSYNLYMAAYSGVSPTNHTNVRTASETELTWTGLTNGTTYYFVVTGENAGGESVSGPDAHGTPRDPYDASQTSRLWPMGGESSGNQHFGAALSIDGDYAVVGAPFNTDDQSHTWRGAAYVFHRTGINDWESCVQIAMDEPQSYASFGASVGISGDYLACGAPGADGSAGAVFVYLRVDENAWGTATRLTAPVPQADAEFGSHLAMSGDYLAVTNGWSTEAYVFHRTGPNAWESVHTFTLPALNQVRTIAANGEYVVAGASEAAYVFRRVGTNSWDIGVKLVASDSVDDDTFGETVAVGRDFVVVGASYQSNGGMSRGSAYVFERIAANSWAQGEKLVCPDLGNYDFFGASVSVSGDLVAVGAYGDDDTGDGDGAFYVYERQADDTWASARKVVTTNVAAFGRKVSVSGPYALVSAPGSITFIEGAYVSYAFEP